MLGEWVNKLSVGIFVFAFIVICFLAYEVREKRREHEKRILLDLLDFQRNTFHKELEGYERLMKTEHDMKNYLLGIRYYMEQGDVGAGLNYLDAVLYQLNGAGRWIVSEENRKTIWGSVINMKSAEAKEDGIDLKQDVFPGRYEEIQPLDLCVVLGNLLDNAVEAERKNESKKEILLEMREEKRLVYITISNWIDEPYRKAAGEMISMKQNSAQHGIGLSSVKEVVGKYGGRFEAGMDGEYFRVRVVMPIFGRI